MIANCVNANLYGSTADFRIFLFFTQYDCIELYSSKSQAEDAEKSDELKSVGKIEFFYVVVPTEFLANFWRWPIKLSLLVFTDDIEVFPMQERFLFINSRTILINEQEE